MDAFFELWAKAFDGLLSALGELFSDLFRLS